MSIKFRDDMIPGDWRGAQAESGLSDASRASEPLPSTWEITKQSWDEAVHKTNQNALTVDAYDNYESVTRRIRDATSSKDIVNPLSIPNDELPAGLALEQWKAQIGELRKKHPDALPWDDLIAEPDRKAYAKMKEVADASEKMNDRLGMVQGNQIPYLRNVPIVREMAAVGTNLINRPISTAAQFAGGFAGAMTSPLDAAVNLIGFGAGSKSLSLLKNATRNAAANAVGQMPLSALKMADYEKAGLPHGWDVWLSEVEGAASGGAVLDAAFRAPVRAVRKARGETGLGGALLDAVPETTIARPSTMPDISPETFKAAADGDLKATREILEKTGAIDDPTVRGALNHAETIGKLDSDQLARLKEMGIAAPEGMRIMDGLMSGSYTRPADMIPDLDRMQNPLPPVIPDAHVERVVNVAKADLATLNPGLAEFVAQAVESRVQEIEGPVRAALARLDEKHTPDAVARDLAADIQKVMSDPETAQRIGNTVRLTSGGAHPVEMARILQDAPELKRRLNPEIGRHADALALATLDEAQLSRITSGEVPTPVAVHIANHVRPEHQARAFDDIARARPEDMPSAIRLLDELVPDETKPEGVPLDRSGGLDDPIGAEAKARTERMKEEASEAVEAAQEPIKERDKLSSKVDSLKGEIAKAELKDALTEADALKIARARAELAEAEPKLLALQAELNPDKEAARALYDVAMAAVAQRRAMDVHMAVAHAVALGRTIAPDGTKIEVRSDEMRDPVSGNLIEAYYDKGASSAIVLARYAADQAARVSHEVVHALVDRGALTAAEVKLLAKEARETAGVFDAAKRQQYADAYKDRPNLEALLDEEAAAHLIDARVKGTAKGEANTVAGRMAQLIERIRNLLDGYGFKTADDVVAAVLSGEAARRVEVQRFMQAEDLTAVAVKPDAMFRFSDYLMPTSLDRLAKAHGATSITKIRPWQKHPGPVLAFHGTTAAFDRFDASEATDIGQHFGTPEQANKFAIGKTFRGDRTGSDGRVLPVVLDIKNPVTLPDLGAWDPDYVVAELKKSAKIEVSPDLKELADVVGGGSGGRRGFNERLRQELVAQGYDGIRYLNKVEGMGATWSYIAIKPDTVKSATSGDTMFAFAGERARTADLDALATAKEMETSGQPREAIWTATGWFKGVDGKWRFEIDDSGAKFTPSAPKPHDKYTSYDVASQALPHDALYAAYPQLSDIDFITTSLSGGGSYTPARLSDGLGPQVNVGLDAPSSGPSRKSVALHELQHAVQDEEGTARGGNAAALAADLASPEAWVARMPYVIRQMMDERGLSTNSSRIKAWPEIKEELRQRIADDTGQPANFGRAVDGMDGADRAAEMAGTMSLDDLRQTAMNTLRQTGKATYNRLAGEVEARTVQKRMDMSPDERRSRPPWLDYDVPEDQQIVRFADGKSVSQLSYSEPPPVEGFPTIKGNVMFAFNAFHGSPHDFDRFDRSKIGNRAGAGAQAYGRGFYFSESKDVAQFYRDNIQNYNNFAKWVGPGQAPPEVLEAFSSMQTASSYGRKIRWSYDDAVLEARSAYLAAPPSERQEYRRRWKVLNDARQHVTEDVTGDGRLYEVKIKVDLEDIISVDVNVVTAAELKQIEKSGAPGLKYRDPGGAQNYVIFDDSLIEIVAKDGKPIENAERQSVIDGMTGKKDGTAKSEPMFALADRETGQSMRRDLDALGYYSQALEAARSLKQAKGTPEQMLAQLKSAGVKDAEIEATGLRQVLEGRPSITRSEIVSHLEGNRVGMRGVKYDSPQASEWGDLPTPAEGSQAAKLSNQFVNNGSKWTDRDGNDITEVARELAGRPTDDNGMSVYTFRDGSRLVVTDGGWDVGGPSRKGKWQSYSLDPSNPTYRETVLHLPGWDERTRGKNMTAEQQNAMPNDFTAGHFPEPNIVGHMMTSMTKHDGRPVYTLDQIQSDWGQKLRDGGVRDEAKIAELNAKYTSARDTANGFYRQADVWAAAKIGDTDKALTDYSPEDVRHIVRSKVARLKDANPDESASWSEKLEQSRQQQRLLLAELRTAEASTSGHPLVNTTDQWVNTTLRRALRQAAEADAAYVAIPHGDTVLSYNPGDTDGMRGFYGSRTSEGIVPKNLRKLLEKIDKESAKPVKVERLETTKGTERYQGDRDGVNVGDKFDPAQTGFTLFPLTDKVKAAVVEQGQPMFALADIRSLIESNIVDPATLRSVARRAGAILIDDIGHAAPDRVLAFHGSSAPWAMDKFDVARNASGHTVNAMFFGTATDANYFSAHVAVAPALIDTREFSVVDWLPAAKRIAGARKDDLMFDGRVMDAIMKAQHEAGKSGVIVRGLRTDSFLPSTNYVLVFEGGKGRVVSPTSGDTMFALRDEPKVPKPLLDQEYAALDRMNQVRELIEACR